MRHLTAALCLGAVVALSGCNSWPFRRDQAGALGPRVSGETPTAAQLVAYLNDNARKINALECNDLDLDCREGMQSVGLRGQMVCQKPRDFRMSAELFGKQAVDVGSNRQEFWFWISRMQPPYQFHCSYDDLKRGVRLPFPFQPDWVMTALGMAEYDQPPENYRVDPDSATVKLVEQTTSTQGQPVQKVTVFRRGQARGNGPQVIGHVMKDARNREICSAQISQAHVDPTTLAVVPTRVRLEWPDQKIRMDLTLHKVTVNPSDVPQRSAGLFTRPTLANVEAFDMARHEVDSRTGLRRVNGTMP